VRSHSAFAFRLSVFASGLRRGGPDTCVTRTNTNKRDGRDAREMWRALSLSLSLSLRKESLRQLQKCQSQNKKYKIAARRNVIEQRAVAGPVQSGRESFWLFSFLFFLRRSPPRPETAGTARTSQREMCLRPIEKELKTASWRRVENHCHGASYRGTMAAASKHRSIERIETHRFTSHDPYLSVLLPLKVSSPCRNK
jgi:hypothetical protein